METKFKAAEKDFAEHRFGKASQALSTCLDLQRQIAGPDSMDALDLMGALAECLVQEGKYERAAAVLEGCWEARVRLLGPDHPDSLAAEHGLRSLALFFQGRGQRDDAIRLFHLDPASEC